MEDNPQIKINVDTSELRKAIEEAGNRGYELLQPQRPPVKKDTHLILINVWMAVAVLATPDRHWVAVATGAIIAAYNLSCLLWSSKVRPYEP